MVADVTSNCTDPDLVEQLHLYKRAVCHYEYLLLLGVSARLLTNDKTVSEPFSSWITPAAATSGLCGSVVPLLKDFFLASLLQAD